MNKQFFNGLIQSVGFVIVIAIIYLIHALVEQYFPQDVHSVFPIILLFCFGCSFIFFSHRKKQLTRQDPSGNEHSLYDYNNINYMIGGYLVILLILDFMGDEQLPDWTFAIFLLYVSMSKVQKIFKAMQQRITELEQKLNEQNVPQRVTTEEAKNEE